MRPRICMLSACTLSIALSFGIAAKAADLPKEGAYKGTYAGHGTYKAIPVGKERVLFVWDENGLSLSNGLFDHTTAHCWGTSDYVKGVGHDEGYCLATDTDGDQILQAVVTENHAIDAKSYGGTAKDLGGTGKYAGITGGEPGNMCHSGEFKAPEGTYVQYCTFAGQYKIP